MPFGLVKQFRRKDGKTVFEYGFKKEDMDAARQDWEVLVRKHMIKNAAKAFPPAPPKVEIFIPRVSAIQKQDAIEKHNDGSEMQIVNKTNGNFQIIVQNAAATRKREKLPLHSKQEIED